MAKTLFIEDKLIEMLLKHFEWRWVDDDTKSIAPYLVDKDNNIVYGNEYEMFEIPETTLVTEGGELYRCDGVLLFGDGCMEFHDVEDYDAVHWSTFTDASVLLVTEIVEIITKPN